MRTLLAAALAAVLLTGSVRPAAAQIKRGPFTGPGRSVRERAFDQRHLRLELAFDWPACRVDCRAEHTLIPLDTVDRLEFDAAGLAVERVARADGTALAFDVQPEKLVVSLDRPHPAGQTLRLAINYRLDRPAHGLHFVVPDEYQPDQPPMAWTLGEPEYAHHWFPCTDTPADRFTSELLVTVPASLTAISNGRLAARRENADGTATWHWVQEKDHVAYLVSLVVGQFAALEQPGEGIPMTCYVPPGRQAEAERSFARTPAAVRFFAQRLGCPYPWARYDQVCVDEFTWGGMEHTSAATLNLATLHDERAELDVSSEPLVVHELAHQWFGNLATAKDWAEIWLNEGFATYLESVWLEHDRGPDEADWVRREQAERYFGEDPQRYRRPLVSYRYEAPWNVFDSHSYPKGAWVVHMLRAVLGDEPFWRGVAAYLQCHAHRAVETADLRIALEETTGHGLRWFFDQWTDRGGYPIYEASYQWDEAARAVRLTVRQTQPVDDLTPRFRMPIEIDLVTDEGRTTRQITVVQAEETFDLPLPARPRRVLFDPRAKVLKRLTFTKGRDEWLGQLREEPRAITRVEAVLALARLADDDAVATALCEAAVSDPFWGVRLEAVKALGARAGDRVRTTLLAVAGGDAKAAVRREAVKSLGNFSHDACRQMLRDRLARDPSYYVAADALTALVKIDRENCRGDVLAAWDRPSHQDVLLKAACDAWAELDPAAAKPRLLALLEPPSPPTRRVAPLAALARVGPQDPLVLAALVRQLDADHVEVRRAAVDALGATGNPAARPPLEARRSRETTGGILRALDDALEKLRRY